MKNVKRLYQYFSVGERILWFASLGLILLSFLIFDRSAPLNLIASLVGVTSLIFCAKGNPFGQVLMILFSLIYGGISYFCAYYGEMITYLGMTLPMAVVALVSWLRHPYEGNRSQVEVNRLKGREFLFALLLTCGVTWAFYFILRKLETANLLPSTLSVATSFYAVYLTFRRSPYFALAYAGNDVVLIFLWLLAAIKEPSYFSVVICFVAFLVNDLYGFMNWRRMARRQGIE